MMTLWRHRGLWVGVHWEPRDCWIGAYWTYKHGTMQTTDGEPVLHWDREWHLYVCLLPCVPIHVVVPCDARTTKEYYANKY